LPSTYIDKHDIRFIEQYPINGPYKAAQPPGWCAMAQRPAQMLLHRFQSTNFLNLLIKPHIWDMEELSYLSNT